jgi:hypothetical protein
LPLPVEEKDHITVCQCLRGLLKKDIIELGCSLGLYYSTLKEMETLPADMVQAWLMRMDNVTEKSGMPTAGSLINALESQKLTEHVDRVKTSFKIT